MDIGSSESVGWLLMLGSSVGALIGAIIGSWLKGYFGEKGKRLATRQDLANVVREVRAVTKTTESIKADLSGGLWEAQARWSAKKETYEALLELLEDLKGCYITMEYACVNLLGVDAINKAADKADSIAARFRRAMARARLFLSPAVVEAWQKLTVLDQSQGQPNQNVAVKCAEALRVFEQLTADILAAAEEDLKLKS